jgi:hypothetical protein
MKEHGLVIGAQCKRPPGSEICSQIVISSGGRENQKQRIDEKEQRTCGHGVRWSADGISLHFASFFGCSMILGCDAIIPFPLTSCHGIELSAM